MKNSVDYSMRPGRIKYPRKWLLAVVLVMVMAICSLSLSAGGCMLRQYAYEDELLESHNKMVDLQDELVEINQQILDDQLVFCNKFGEYFDPENIDYGGLRSILDKIDGDVRAMRRLIGELRSETARFAGYCEILDGDKGQYADEFIENTRMANKYIEMAIDDIGKSVYHWRVALDNFSAGYLDEGNEDMAQANKHVEQYDEHISLQNEYASKAYEADIKFMMAMGWEELEE